MSFHFVEFFLVNERFAMYVALLLVLNTGVLAGIVELAGVLVLRTIFRISTTAVCIDWVCCSTYIVVHFCSIQV